MNISTKNSTQYVIPFTILKQAFEFKPGKSGLVATISYDNLLKVLQSMLRSIPFDEEWYLSAYPDVAKAIEDGVVQSARQHFVENGYFEGRAPSPLVVDEEWYLKAYPDVAAAIESGKLDSASKHFRDTGYLEGRLPEAL
jgi:hypothetical protein